MGNSLCASKEEIILSDQEQVEFLNLLSSSFNKLESYSEKIKDSEVNTKMIQYMFILNCLKEITPFLEALEKGRKCEGGLKIIFDEIFTAVKNNDRETYDSKILKLKEYFKEG